MGWKEGLTAEEFVARGLSANGWAIEARNYRRKGHEIDMIVSRGDRLICVEVKGRSAQEAAHPANLMGYRKLEKLRTGMLLWLKDEAPEETRHVEFWLCSVRLPTSRNQVEWTQIEN